jgi:hypothetical protein
MLGRLIRSPVGILAFETEAGRALRVVIGVENTSEIATFLGSRANSETAHGLYVDLFARGLHQRLATIEEGVQSYRRAIAEQKARARASGNIHRLRALLAEEEVGERRLVHVLSEKYLRLESAFETTRALRLGDENFLGRTQIFKKNISQMDEAIDQAVARIRTNQRSFSPVLASQLNDAERWWHGLGSRMDTCLATTPREQRNLRSFSYWASEVGVDQTVAVGGYVLAHGTQDVNLADLSVDMLSALFSTAVGNAMAASSDRVTVQWMRVVGGEMLLENPFDATLYYLYPAQRIMQQDTTEPELRDALIRYSFDNAWSLGSARAFVSIYRISDGLACLYGNNGQVQMATSVYRFAFAAAERFGFFVVRNQMLDH